MASPAEQTAVEAISEMSTTACERQSQAPHVLVASNDITAPQSQVQKGADVYNDGCDSSRKGEILSSVLCLLRQGRV